MEDKLFAELLNCVREAKAIINDHKKTSKTNKFEKQNNTQIKCN